EPVSTLVSTEPMMFEDVDSAPILKQRREALGREGIRSLLAIPMTIRGEASATLVFYYRQRHQFGEAEIQAARALANLGAGAITTAELYEEQEQGHKQATFLAQIGGALAGSLDYAATLKVVATLAVPHIADWCAVDLAGDGGAVNRLAMAPADAAGMELAQVFQERYSEDSGSEYSVAHVIRTGKPVMLEQLTDDVIVASTRTDNQLRNPRALQISSFMIVPLLAHGRTLGALSFVSSESGRRYGAGDLRVAED